MADRGIIFSPPMVRALLAGRKSQTRRLIKGLGDEIDNSGDCESVIDLATGKTFRVPHRPGDRLFVRERWQTSADLDHMKPKLLPISSPFCYCADSKFINLKGRSAHFMRSRPSIHMPRKFSRLWLGVTEARIERVQDISEADAQAEGAEEIDRQFDCSLSNAHRIDFANTYSYRLGFRRIWESLHTKEGQRWDDNPWVSVTCFDVRQGNIDVEKAAA